jgi:hypothetical protein
MKDTRITQDIAYHQPISKNDSDQQLLHGGKFKSILGPSESYASDKISITSRLQLEAIFGYQFVEKVEISSPILIKKKKRASSSSSTALKAAGGTSMESLFGYQLLPISAKKKIKTVLNSVADVHLVEAPTVNSTPNADAADVDKSTDLANFYSTFTVDENDLEDFSQVIDEDLNGANKENVHTGADKEGRPAISYYECKICDKRFLKRWVLQGHMR